MAEAFQPTKCPYCGMVHTTKCPLVKAFEYHTDGSLKRVEFYSQADHHPIHPLIDPAGPGPTHPRATSITWAVGDKYV